jgi:ribonucleoside-diphosphate reductase alpha chain
VVFETRGAEIPKGWSQLATDIAVSKYFRRAGLFTATRARARPAWQVVYRIAHSIREAGELAGLLRRPDEADTFEAELSWMLVHQYGAFNSPVWFNCGLFQRYGIAGQGGNWAWDEATAARSPRRPTPTSARSARRASSSRCKTTSWASSSS